MILGAGHSPSSSSQIAFRQASLGVGALMKGAETRAQKIAAAQAHADWSTGAMWVFLGG